MGLSSVRVQYRVVPALLVALLSAACASGVPPTITPRPTPVPTASPVVSPVASNASLGFDVLPPEAPVEVRAAIPGQRICFLVTLDPDAAGTEPVTVRASASGASIEKIVPSELRAGQVGEVWVVPDATTTEATATVTFTATMAGASTSMQRTIAIMPMVDERAADARPYLERWAAWLESAHPELGITAATAWEPVFVSTLLVVSHYSYYSPDWELTLLWHVMIPPSDWSEIQLRHRWTESAPSLAFRMDSVSGGTEPHPVDPPDVVTR